MDTYRVRMLRGATRELALLDKTSGRRVLQRIRWLSEHIELTMLKALKGELSGLYRMREGDYRIIYQVLRKENLIIIHSIGHRKDVYR